MRRNQLINLLARNQSRGIFASEQTAQNEATVYLYDVIVADNYWGGISPLDFIKELLAIDAQTIHLRINSPGGDVFAARAMEQAIKEHPSNIIAHVDGYAASASSYIALAADSVQIAEGGFFMIHKAWTLAYGNSHDLKQTADLLDKIDQSLINTYASATGQDPAQIEQWMQAETWFNAQEAVDYGFASSIATGNDKSASNQLEWDLSAYSHAPKIDNKSNETETKEPEPENSPADLSSYARHLAYIKRTAA